MRCARGVGRSIASGGRKTLVSLMRGRVLEPCQLEWRCLLGGIVRDVVRESASGLPLVREQLPSATLVLAGKHSDEVAAFAARKDVVATRFVEGMPAMVRSCDVGCRARPSR